MFPLTRHYEWTEKCADLDLSVFLTAYNNTTIARLHGPLDVVLVTHNYLPVLLVQQTLWLIILIASWCMGIALSFQTCAHAVVVWYLLWDCQLWVDFSHVPAERLTLETPLQNETLSKFKTVEWSQLPRGGKVVEVLFELVKPHLCDTLFVSIRKTKTEISHATLRITS